MDDNSLDGMKLINDIKNAGVRSRILAASIRDPQSVGTAFALGADICTVPVAVFEKMYHHVLTDKGIEQFNKDAS
jgi:transaldolase